MGPPLEELCVRRQSTFRLLWWPEAFLFSELTPCEESVTERHIIDTANVGQSDRSMCELCRVSCTCRKSWSLRERINYTYVSAALRDLGTAVNYRLGVKCDASYCWHSNTRALSLTTNRVQNLSAIQRIPETIWTCFSPSGSLLSASREEFTHMKIFAGIGRFLMNSSTQR